MSSETEALREEMHALQRQSARLEELEAENGRLRAALSANGAGTVNAASPALDSAPDDGSIYRTLVEQSADAVVVLQDGKTVYRSPNWERLLGYTVEETAGQSFLDIVAPEHRERARDEYMRRLRGEDTGQFSELDVIARDGTRVTVETRTSPIGYRGRPAFAVTLRDVAVRKVAEEALRASQARFEGMVEAAHDAIISMDAQQRITSYNGAAERIFGYTADEVLGQPITTLMPERYQAAHAGHVQGFRSSPGGSRGMGARAEVRGLRKDGTEFPAEASIARIMGRPEPEYMAMLRDITDRHAAEEHNRRLAAIVEASPNAILQADTSLNIISWNKAAEQLYGYTAEEVMGRQARFLRPQGADEAIEQLHNTVRDGASVLGHETQRVARDGRVIDVSLTLFPFRDRTGAVAGGVAIATDVTAQKRAAAALRESEERLRLVLEATTEGIWDWNVQTGEVWFSPSWCASLGYEPGELAPHHSSWEHVIHPRDRRRVRAALNAHLQGRSEIYECETRLLTKSGEWRPSLERGRVVEWDEAGSPLRMVAIDVDLSARKRAEESEKRLSETLESISDGFLTLSRDWTFTYVNAHAAEMLGRPRSELLLQPFLAVFPASASSPFHEACERAMAAGERVPFSDHSPRLGRWFEGSASPHPDGVAVYFRDVSAKHDAEEALHRSNEQLRLTMDAAHVGTWEWDRATDRMTLSEGIEAILGLPEGAFLETFRGGLATVHPDDRQRVQELAQRSGETGEPLTVEYRHLLSDGQTRWLAAQGNVIRDAGGAVTGMTGTIADVTGHRTVEQALRKSEASLSEAQRIARLGHWDWDVVTGSLWWSDEIYRIFGLHSQEFAATYSAFLERIHPADRQAVEDRVAQALNREELYEIDHRIVLPGGEERSVHEKGEVTFDESGAPIRMTGTVQDVTEARQVEAALRRQKELLSTVVGGAPLVIFATDREGVFTLSDGKALALIGLQPGEAVGQSAFVMFRDTPGVAENLRRALAGETVTFSSTLGELTFEALYAPLYDGSGQVDGVIGVALDTTERARLQEQLLHSQKMEGIGRLAGGVAHDFNNLLTAIISYSEFVAASFAPQDERRDDILEVLKAANRAAELTRQLLSFARRQMVEPKVVSVNDLMLGTDRLLRRLLGEDVELVTVPHAGVPEVEIDPGQFEQMLVNLAVNARDAMPEGGTLTMETGRALLEGRDAVRADLPAGRYVTLAVSDTGTGIAEEIREQIFEPFFTTKELGKGTGLGLATCYGIARQAGGTILVSSEVGKGTTFTIYLPVASGARRQPGEAGEQPALQGSETLLLVEDEPQVLELAARALRAVGYTVLTAASGAEALEKARGHEGAIDLLITDVVMPQMSGVRLVEQMAEVRPGLGVLYMSGYTDEAIGQHGALDHGAALLPKPFTPAGLGFRVREVLDKAPVN